MEPLQDWRSPQFEEQLSRLDRGGITFEFLRRNKQYRKDYHAVAEAVVSGRLEKREAIARLSRRWGWPFAADPAASALVVQPIWLPQLNPCHAHCHGRAGRLCRAFLTLTRNAIHSRRTEQRRIAWCRRRRTRRSRRLASER